MPLVVLGLNHRTAPVEVRERFAYAPDSVGGALTRLRAGQAGLEVVLLSTCNRMELYASAADVDGRTLVQRLGRFLHDERPHGLGVDFYQHCDGAAAEHVFRVASGLDSLVLGETEILGQLKSAYECARTGGFTGAVLNRVFQRAFFVAKKVRSETRIQHGHTSVASVAVDLAERIFDRLDQRVVLVLGAGDTSEKTARALQSRGARSVLVSNRNYERAAALAAELGGRAIRFDAWAQEFPRIDIVVSATGAPHVILTRQHLESLHRERGARPLLLIDLAVPRDIDSDCEQLDDVFLYNVDHLQAVADQATRLRHEEVQRCEEMIRAQASDWAAALMELRGARGRGGSDTPG